MQMIHPDGFGAPRPIEVPFLLGAAGPEGHRHGAGAGRRRVHGRRRRRRPVSATKPCLMFGTVVDDADDLSSERVMAAAGHGAAVYYHFWFENGRSMADLPRGEDWLAAYADIPADVRHLAVHDRHLIGVNDRDRAFVTPEILQAMGATFRPEELRERLGAMAASGMTEIAYQPAGPDIPRELEAFAKAVRG